jgi:DNA-binding transcriptional ArsR family regulator
LGFDYDRVMGAEPDISAIAAAIGEPARERMLQALMDGRALTATELAVEAGVAASTASSHVARLERAGLVTRTVQGRHRYFRIATGTIAELLEGMMGIAAGRRTVRTGPRDEALRRARVCYDHLAGERAIVLLERLRERRLVRGDGGFLELTADGESWLGSIGIDLDALRGKRRPLVRSCLDWSERRDHLAGAVGAAVLDRLLALRLATRDPVGRALAISSRGEAFLSTLQLPRR